MDYNWKKRRWSAVDSNLGPKDGTVTSLQCDQIWQFFALWAAF